MKIAIILFAWLIAAGVPAGDDAVEQVSAALARGIAAEAASDPQAMLAAAQRLDSLGARPAADQDDLSGRWRELARRRGLVPQANWRGRALGPGYRRGSLPPGAAVVTEQVFLAGQKAVIALVPQPGRTLAFRVESPERDICDRVVAPPRASCAWLPLFTTRVKINISNRGTAAAGYFLVSN